MKQLDPRPVQQRTACLEVTEPPYLAAEAMILRLDFHAHWPADRTIYSSRLDGLEGYNHTQ